MIVLDTHAWIWWVGNPKKLSQAARRSIADAREIAVAASSCWEIAMLVEKDRLELDRDVLVWIRQALALPKVIFAPLSPEIAVAAARLGDEFPGDPADRMIVATALDRKSTLVTKDRRLRSFQAVTTVW
ncbi:MAG: type II toxin-antitoxin system VapC family toxin [Planctomycetes bacterium]|nr:type II toxin-antitoxin system VapC family toxin [Planctomycetota bacterium]